MSKHFAGARIRTLRRGRNLTQQEMARRLGLSTSYLNQLENDQRPLTVTVLMALSQHFDVDPAFFSPDHDARTISELRDAFPTVPDDQLADLAARYPEFVSEVLDLADRAPVAVDDSPYRLVRDFFYDAHNYVHELDVLGEELARRLGEPQLRLTRLSTSLDRDLGIIVRFRKLTSGPRRVFHPETRELHLRTGLSEAQLCFELALQYGLSAHADLLREILALARDYPQIVGTFPFCFTDYRDPSKVPNGFWDELNLKGLVDYRRHKKLAFEAVKAAYQPGGSR